MHYWIDEALLLDPRDITGPVLARMVPNCAEPDTWAEVLCPSFVMAGIESNHDIALFLAHAGHESGSFHQLEESLNYSVESLALLFGRHRISLEDIDRYGRKAGQRANQEMLGNLLYGGTWGRTDLGNTQPGDGYKYRGRGIFQLTGRSNYTRCSEATGLDLVSDPGLLARDPVAAATSAFWFWDDRVTSRDVKGSTRQINGGTNGLADRIERYKRALNVLEGV